VQSAEQCRDCAAEYKYLGMQPGISIRRADLLMSISHSWLVLAGQLERLSWKRKASRPCSKSNWWPWLP
jgi:hypothetical protein